MTRRLLIINAVITAAVGLCGCMVGPNFHRPEATVPPGWLESVDNGVSAQPSDYRSWWKVFGDPVLDKLIDRAYSDNLTLQIAGVRVLEARAQLGVAAGNFYPQSQQAGGYLERNRLSRAAPQAAGGLYEYNQASLGLSATWELDFWGKFRRAIESAGAAWLASAANYDNALVTLTADVASSYINIRTLEKRIEIARQNVETQKQDLQITEARLRYGTVSELDVEQARTALDTTMATVPALETQLRRQKDALCVLLGMAPNDLSDILSGGPREIPVSPPGVVAGIPVDLLRRRPDIRSAELQAWAQSARIGVAKADLYPAFTLNGMVGFLSTNIDNERIADIFHWGNFNYLVGPSFAWNIFNYGQITNNVRYQDALLEELVLTYKQTVLSAEQDVEDNMGAFFKGRQQADLLAQGAGAAKKSLGLAVKQYTEGTVDFTTVLSSQQALLSTQDSLASTLGGVAASLVAVYRALGGGWEIREGKTLVSPEVKKEMESRTDWGGLLAPESYNPAIVEKPSGSIRAPDW